MAMKGLSVVIVDLVDGADVGMVQSGGRLRLALESTQGLRVLGHFVRQEFQSDEAVKLDVFSFVDNSHPAPAELLHNAVVRDGLTDH
jgi:hypothetical protein